MQLIQYNIKNGCISSFENHLKLASVVHLKTAENKLICCVLEILIVCPTFTKKSCNIYFRVRLGERELLNHLQHSILRSSTFFFFFPLFHQATLWIERKMNSIQNWKSISRLTYERSITEMYNTGGDKESRV